jgi:hypothetical protein
MTDLSAPSLMSARIDLYFSSLLLVSLGNRDAIEDVLLTFKYMTDSYRKIGTYMTFLVPLRGMYYDIPASIEWLRAHKDQLQWDSEHEMFVLR